MLNSLQEEFAGVVAQSRVAACPRTLGAGADGRE